ncbi:MAG TPA: hypothetical protein VMF52_20615 [Steroidobacteraceae bacterium]|nr:hypothetical protein [Steroidobacteraceae bacterium]
MLPLLGNLRRFATLMLVGVTPVMAGDPVEVYLKTPTEVAEQQQLEAVLRALPAQVEKWRATSHRSVTYVVKQSHADMLVPDPCEGLPIRVTMVRDRLLSAVYESSGGHCKRGAAASSRSPRGQKRYFVPDQLFQRIAQAEKELRCYKQPATTDCLATALRVTYDEKTGLPLKIEDYSDVVSDYYWSLEVTDIQVVP